MRPRQLVFFGIIAGLVLAVPALHVVSALTRNLDYRALVHGRDVASPPVGTPAEARLALRLALSRGDWASAGQALRASDPADRLPPLLVVRDALDRVARGDRTGARAALGTLDPQVGYDAEVWYRIGAAAEAAGDASGARAAYEKGAARDPHAPWAEGRYRAALIAERDGAWATIIQELADVFATATERDLAEPVQLLEPGGARWQGAFLLLADAYDHLQRAGDAEAVYARLAQIELPHVDWTWNRTLVGLARHRATRGAFGDALEPLARALDATSALDPDDRRRFELDTAATVDGIVKQSVAAGRFDAVAAAEARLLATSAGTLFVRGVVAEQRCDWTAARDAYAAASRALGGRGGAHLAGRPVVRPCPR